METIPLPSKISIKEGKNEYNSIFSIEPCYPGYGLTLGNALRRILLSSLPGAAVTSYKIKGAQHEFSSIEGVKEDLVDISINLKQLRLKVFTDQPVRLELKAKGEKKVTAGDITPNSEVEVINKDLTILTLTEKTAQVDMELVISRGRGYLTAESRESEELEIGMISIDANYTPIKRVGFNVESMRVGQMTNWDRLNLDIETDGTLSPLEAINIALKDLIDHFSFIQQNFPQATEASVKTKSEIVEEKTEKTDDKPAEEKEKPAKRGRKPKKEKAV